MEEADSSAHRGGSAFPTTQWTVIIEAVSTNPERARAALEKLCAAYRQAIVNWFKRKDFYQDPEDLAQGFYLYLLEKSLLAHEDLLADARSGTGRFRRFLKAALMNYLRDNWDKLRAEKRGGHVEILPLIEGDIDIQSQGGKDSLFDINFAMHIHRKVMSLLMPPEELKPHIFQKDSTEGWDEIAARLKKTSTAVRKEVSRLRRRHWESFRDEVAQIVTPADKAEETRYLYELLFRNLPA